MKSLLKTLALVVALIVFVGTAMATPNSQVRPDWAMARGVVSAPMSDGPIQPVMRAMSDGPIQPTIHSMSDGPIQPA